MLAVLNLSKLLNRRIVCLLIIILFGSSFFHLYSQKYNFQNYSVQEGLAHSLVYTIYQDDHANIWLGTAGGLSMYDGKNFHNYTTVNGLPTNYIGQVTGDKFGNIWFISGRLATGRLVKFDRNNFSIITTVQGLVSDEINHLLYDRNDNLWVATSGGLSKINVKEYTLLYQAGKSTIASVESFIIADGLLSENVQIIFEDSRGRIWIGTDKGLNWIGEDGNVNSIGSPESDTISKVTSLSEDLFGRIWLGTTHGVFRISGVSSLPMTPLVTKFGLESGFTGGTVNEISKDNRGNMWFATTEGLIMFDGSTFRNMLSETNQPTGNVRDVLADSRGEVWIGTDDGLFKYDHLTMTKFGIENGLSNNRIYALLEGRDGNIWITTFGGGVCKFKGETFINYTESDGLVADMIWAVKSDVDGNVWIGTDKGLSLFRNDAKAMTNGVKRTIFFNYSTDDGLPGNTVNYVFEDDKNNLWFACVGGIAILRRDKIVIQNVMGRPAFRFEEMNVAVPLSNPIFRTIYQAHGGNMWIGTNHGVLEYDGVNFTKRFENTQLNDVNVYSIFQDSRGLFWFGTDAGICRTDGNQVTFFEIDYGIKDRRVVPILEDRQGNIWFGTLNNGLYRYDGTEFSHINVEQGLSANPVYSMITDGYGNLLIGTNNGLNKFNYQKYNTSGKIEIKQYNVREGFFGNECNKNALCEDSEGNFLFGTVKGVVSYNPALDLNISNEPSTNITSIKLFYEKTDWSAHSEKLTSWYSLPTQLVLPYDLNHITFNFIGVSLTIPEKVRYRFMLEGLDKEWHDPTTLNEITYTNLAHGDYKFKVKASGEAGLWNSNPAEFSFSITPPFWKTWLFYSFLTATIFVVLFQVIRWRDSQFKKKQLELEDLVKSRTSELDRKNRDITESIGYAQRIQEAALPPMEWIEKLLLEHFIIYNPRDIVSGDFYWINKPSGIKVSSSKDIIIAAVDCTGHGVPGAFMSIVASNLLDQAVVDDEKTKPSEILDDVNEGLEKALRKSVQKRVTDGMDMALIKLNLQMRKLEYAGAVNPLWILRDSAKGGEIIVIDADRVSIGLQRRTADFTYKNNVVQLQKNDRLFIFTDGLTDQFGGGTGEKFKSRRFKEVLIETRDLPMREQKESILDAIREWQGDFDQVDDMLVIGIQV
ncbi:MAG: hypothetical protein COB85_05740 [Bacteroidetes bacterium]|nr:MAG: hypothetical protein COB85_05740 [Bacteroidota bacterium]